MEMVEVSVCGCVTERERHTHQVVFRKIVSFILFKAMKLQIHPDPSDNYS